MLFRGFSVFNSTVTEKSLAFSILHLMSLDLDLCGVCDFIHT